MRETRWDQHLAAILCTQFHACPGGEAGGAETQIDGDVEHSTAQAADQLGLGPGRRLKVQAAQRPGPGGEALGVLHPVNADACDVQSAALPGFAQPATPVMVAPGRQQQNVG